jgi:hypothetical protein
LVIKPFNANESFQSKEPDKYFWDRLMRTLIVAGYGNYQKVEEADLVAAATFLYLADDVDERLRRHLSS